MSPIFIPLICFWFVDIPLMIYDMQKIHPSFILHSLTTTTAHEPTWPWPPQTNILIGHLLMVWLTQNFRGSLYVASSGDLTRRPQFEVISATIVRTCSYQEFSIQMQSPILIGSRSADSPKASHYAQTPKDMNRRQHNITAILGVVTLFNHPTTPSSIPTRLCVIFVSSCFLYSF